MLERLLIVGLGSIGKRHARIVRELVPGVEIVALRRQNGQDFNASDVDYCVTSLDEALQFRPQAAVIANPSSFHLASALPLADAGVHLLVEKPISNSTQGVIELIERCHAQRLTLMTAYNMRFLRSLQRFHDLLEERCVGRVFSVRAEVGQYLPSWRPDSDYRQHVSAKAVLGGGVLLELSHEVDYLRWLFGEVTWVNAIQLKQSALDIDVEDTAHLMLGFAGRAEKKPVVATLSMDFVRHDTARNCTVIGETGSLRWNALVGSIEIFRQGATAWQPLFMCQHSRDESYLEEWRHFLSCISGSQTPQISGQDGLAVLQVIDAARRSSAAGSTVQINRESGNYIVP
jgi:predicted dehydrogenase